MLYCLSLKSIPGVSQYPISIPHKEEFAAVQMYSVLCVLTLLAFNVGVAQPPGNVKPPAERVKNVIRLKAEPFPLSSVQLLPGPFKEAQERNHAYLLSLDPDRLLYNFRVNAGLPSTAEPLGGWEAPGVELRGHFTGHFLSASALAFAATGDNRLKTRADKVVAEIAKCQQRLGPTGYLSAFPEEFLDRVETGKRVWAPWYTLHKIMAGLLDMYLYCGNSQALDVLTRMAGWVNQRAGRLDEVHMQTMLKVEHGGMNEVLRNLSAVTGNREFLNLAERFDHKAFLSPLAHHRDELKGLHANTNIPKVIGAARAYELTGDTSAYEAAMFFWNQIVQKRSYCTGGTGNYEHWRSDPNQLARELSVESHENCCTYNMLRLTEHIFSWSADPRAADYFERALFNGILPTQNPDDGAGLMYYVPMVSGMFKMFGQPDSSYWCCTGTGIESFAKLANGIYFHDDDAVFINLFVPSVLQWGEKGFTLRQETRFPDEEGTTLLVQAAPQFPLTLYVRIPYWVRAGEVTLSVNGVQFGGTTTPSSYLRVNQRWERGDRLEIHLPMRLHLSYIPDDHSMAAIMYGPLVLVGELGHEGMTDAMQNGFNTCDVDREYSDGPALQAPYLAIPSDDVSSWVKPVPEKSLTFRTVSEGRPHEVTLVPFHRLFGQRYVVYWNLISEVGWKIFEEMPLSLPEGIIDRTEVGEARSDRRHNFQIYRPDTGSSGGHRWVQSAYWIRYDLDVTPSQPAKLKCTYSGDDRECSFDVLIDGLLLKSETLAPAGADAFQETMYTIPPEFVREKHRIAVKLRARDNRPTARLIGCEIVSVP
jgi:DUF1680 family protein